MSKTVIIKIFIKGLDNRVLDQTTLIILKKLKESGAEIVGPIPLPVCVNIYKIFSKKDKKVIENRLHKRVIHLINPSEEIIYNMAKINISTGIFLEIQTSI